MTIEVRTDDPDARFAPDAVLLTDPESRGPLTVTQMRRAARLTLLRFAGVDDRNAAEALRGTLLLVDAEDRPDTTGDDEYYDDDLVGLRAVAVEGRDLGVVTDVLHAPASSVLTVTDSDGHEVLVPFVAAIVPDVDTAAGTLTIDPPDGMFDGAGG